jgi:hypothetical protein
VVCWRRRQEKKKKASESAPWRWPPKVGFRKGGSDPFQKYMNLLGTKERDRKKGKEKRK